jgi:hypothetical protein
VRDARRLSNAAKEFWSSRARPEFFVLERNTDEMRLSATWEFLVAAKRAIRVTAGLRNYASAKLRMAIASVPQKNYAPETFGGAFYRLPSRKTRESVQPIRG